MHSDVVRRLDGCVEGDMLGLQSIWSVRPSGTVKKKRSRMKIIMNLASEAISVSIVLSRAQRHYLWHR